MPARGNTGQRGLFQNIEISATSFAKKYRIAKKEILGHLELISGVLFNHYMDCLRVNEFKIQVKNSENSHWNLLEIAEEFGFSSKSNAFRAFKEMQCVIPNECKGKLVFYLSYRTDMLKKFSFPLNITYTNLE